MMNVPENELFSAYLDGELTGEEQAKVEQLLATSPAARQLLDELRALGTSLQALPAYRLKENLSERVLRLAERRMLAEPAGADTPDSRPRLAEAGRRSLLQRVLQPRPLVWSGLAVAVALILLVTEWQAPQPPAGDRVAMAPEAAKTPATGPSIRAVEQPAEEAKQPAAGAVGQGAPSVAPQETPGPGRQAVSKDGASRAESPRADEFAPAEAVDRAADLARKAEQREVKPAVPAAEPSDVAAAVEDQPPADQPHPAQEPVFIVECSLTAEAARRGVFDQILTRHEIARVEEVKEHEPNREPAEREENAPAGVDRPPEEVWVEVEATPAQLQATLAELKARPNDFLAVAPRLNLAQATVRVGGVRIGGRAAAGKPSGSEAFLSGSTPAAGPGIRLGTGTGKAATGQAQGFRVQIGARGGQRAGSPADQTAGADARGRTVPPPAPTKAGPAPPADKAASEDEQVPKRDAEAPTRTDRGLPEVTPPRAVPKYRVRFVLRIVAPDPAPADESIPK